MTPVEQAIFALLASFSVTWLLIPALDGPAQRLGLLDHPDRRKRHQKATPLTGGIALVIGFLLGLALLDIDLGQYWSLPVGILVLMAIGLIDDAIGMSVGARLMIQTAVAAVMVYGNDLQLQVLGNLFGPAWGPVGLGPFAGIFTIACVVFMINAINMVDGLDGLAGGIAIFTFLLLAAAAWLGHGDQTLVTLSLLLALTTTGFLLHNVRMPWRPRARAFLGDTGSMVLGYSIAWLAVALGGQQSAEIYPISIAWIVLIPAMDTFALFFRRIYLGRSPFAPDRSHLHHILHRCGYPVTATVHIIHLTILVSGLFGILAWVYGWPEWVLFILAAMVFLGYSLLLANARYILRWYQRRARSR